MNWLEKKLPPPLVALAFAILMFYLAKLPVWTFTTGMITQALAGICVIIGFSIAGWAVLSFRRVNTTVNPHQPDKSACLITHGIYQYSRNPMYLAMALCLIGWWFYLGTSISLLGVVGFVVYISYFQIRPEEKALKHIFGDSYLTYLKQVRRWL